MARVAHIFDAAFWQGAFSSTILFSVSSFHITELCLLAAMRSYSAYVVDFHLKHIGGESLIKKGVKTTFLSSFDESKREFINKYKRVLLSKWMQSTCTMIYMSKSGLRNYLFNRKHVYSIRKRIYNWFSM